MGLIPFFDSKQTKEEKQIYQRLLAIKNDSFALKTALPKDEKEFLTSPKKEELITKYKFAIEMMNDVQLIRDLNIQNLGKCFDFVDGQYNSLGVRNGIDMSSDVFMGHIRVLASEKKMENEAKASINQANQQYNETVDKTERFVSDIEGRLRQMNNAPGNTRAYDVASKMARETLNDLGLSNEELHNMVVFNNKFPHYRKFVDYIIDRKKDSQQPEFYEKIDNVISMIFYSREDQLPELLFPYILEKKHMGIKLNEKELEIAKKANEQIIYNQDYEKLDLYIKLNFVMFGKSSDQLNEFLNSFNHCNENYLIPAGLRTPSNIETSQEYSSGSFKR